MNNYKHISVLAETTVQMLNIKQGSKYIDATIGGGGHTQQIVERGGIVLGIDQDDDALSYLRDAQKENISKGKLFLIKGNFQSIKELAVGNNFAKVSGILFDIGVSSYQLDSSGRGFSIRRDEELDMRMDKEGELTAYTIINNYSEEKLIDIFYRYGEEHNAKGIAQAISQKRKKNPIRTTRELADLIERLPHKSEDIHPATRVFQAIRIEVNDELGVLRKALQDGVELLESGGRMVVISFHSLEDRIVKQSFESFKRQSIGKVITKKPLIATDEEINRNKRSRSAKLRVFEKN